MPRVLSFFLTFAVFVIGAISTGAEITVKTTSTKGWEKNETLNNLGLTTGSNLSGTGIPAVTLTPIWRADGSLETVSLTINGETHKAGFKTDGTLNSLKVPADMVLFPNGREVLGEHTFANGVEKLVVDGVATERTLDGTLVETSGSGVTNKTEELATSGTGFKFTTTPTVGATTEIAENAAGVPVAKSYAVDPVTGVGIFGESRQYLPGGLLEKITLARGGDLELGYSDDGAKDLTSATWPQVTSGPFTLPSVVQTYGQDRAGRVDEIGDASGARALVYQNGRLKQTTWNSGQLAGYKVVKVLDDYGRDTGFELWRGSSLIHSATKVPNDVSGEVSSVTASGFSAILGRNGARSLESVTRGPVTQRWQRGLSGRILLADTNNTVTGAPSFNYKGIANDEAIAFDGNGRRLKCATAGGEWTYQYTNGQLSSAVHTTLGSFGYQFDGIGRRKNYAGSGNWNDLLNQTLDWENTGNKTLKIAAHPDARVWLKVGTDPTFEIPGFTGSYEHPLPFPSGSGIWQAWDTLAILEGEGDAGANADAKAQQTGAVWVPPVNETLGYDDAGNRESSALWNFGWDAKNQLVRARTKSHNNPSTPQGYDITNANDAEGRRFSKKVNRYQNGSVVEQKVITFLHDGDDIIYEREQLPSGLTTCERKYVWGPDISGTHGGAGGAGGLLLIRETRGNSTIDLYPLYDGTGHVVALADNTGTLQAEYAYGPFGELIHAKGPKASSCPFRYGTKYYDQETGLYNFGLRFLDPITGQWLSREPLGESDSLNLYAYCHNDPVNKIDVLGLKSKWVTDPNNPVTEMPDGSKVINLVWLVDKWFGDDYLDYSKRDTRAFGTNYWDHYLWSKRADGSWGTSSGNQTMLDVATILEEKHHFSTHAKIGTVAMGGYSALLAAPVAGAYGAGSAASSAYFSASTFVARNVVQLGAAGAAAQQAYNRTGPLLTRISYSPTLHGIASEGTFTSPLKPGAMGGWPMFTGMQRGSVPNPFYQWTAAKGETALDWSIVSKTGETRAEHVIAQHGAMDLNKPVQGVFYGDPFPTLNDAWSIAQKQGIQPVTVNGADIYVIPRANSGYAGGLSGQLQNLDTTTIITRQGTSKIITGFPGNGLPFPKP